MTDAIDSMQDDPQETVEFLDSLTGINGDEGVARADAYLTLIKANYATLWGSLVALAAEEPEPDEEDELEEEEKEGGEPVPKDPTDLEPDEALGQDEEPEDEDEDEDDIEGMGELITEPVVEPEAIGAEAQIDMVLFQAEAGPHWVVLADGEPVAKIELSDQPNAEEIEDVFTTPQYQEAIVKGCKSSMGIVNTLTSVKAHWYAGVVDKGTMAKRAREAAVKKQESVVAERLVALKEDLTNHVALAITASLKGMIVANPLKEALITKINAAGVTGAEEIVDEAFEEQGQPYLNELITKAESWMGYSTAAMDDISREILAAKAPKGPTGKQPKKGPAISKKGPSPAMGAEDTANLSGLQERAREAAAQGIVNVPIRSAQGNVFDQRQEEQPQQRVASSLSRLKATRRAETMTKS